LSCDRIAGTCLSCKPGLFGARCGQICSSGCIESMDGNTYCGFDTGFCEIDYCRAGFYLPTCAANCPRNCQVNSIDGLKYCDILSGECSHGCLPGFYGTMCNQICSNNCASSYIKSSTNSTVKVCERNGYCRDGCVTTKYGNVCEKTCLSTCNDDTCARLEGYCLDCDGTQTPRCRTAGIIDWMID